MMGRSDVSVMFINVNGQVLKISWKFFSLYHNKIDCGKINQYTQEQLHGKLHMSYFVNKFLLVQAANIVCYHLGHKSVALCLYSSHRNTL